MELIERMQAAQKDAMRAKDAARLSAIRMMLAAVKDREIAARTAGGPMGEGDVLALLGKMVKSRQDAAAVYDQGGRPELAAKERAEVAVIEEFLPRALSADEAAAAVDAAVAEAGATSVKDMGRVMAILKARHTGQMDFGAAGALVKARLG